MLDSYITELKSVRDAIIKLEADPTSSQSVSSANGGSFSASYMDISKLHSRETELIKRIADLYRSSSGQVCGGLEYPIYCGG